MLLACDSPRIQIDFLVELVPSSPDISWIRYKLPCSRHDCRECCPYAKRQLYQARRLSNANMFWYV